MRQRRLTITFMAASNASCGVSRVVGLDVGISGVLLLGCVKTRIDHRIGIARPQPRDHFELRRIDRVGGDVGNRRQAGTLDAEIERIGDQREPDEDRRGRMAAAACALAPDDDDGAEGEQNGDAGQHQSAGERRQRRHDVERARADDDDGDEVVASEKTRCGAPKWRAARSAVRCRYGGALFENFVVSLGYSRRPLHNAIPLRRIPAVAPRDMRATFTTRTRPHA